MEITRREERIKKIVQALKRSDKIHLKEASELLNVSEMTIRRDLNAEPSSVALLGGYVVMNPQHSGVTSYFVSDQKEKFVQEKRTVGTLAARLVAENDTVFFDCGTTVPYIIDAIPEDLPFTAICFSLNTFLALQDKPQCRIILCGGEFKANNYIFNSVSRHSELDNFCPGKAFISAGGVSLKYGATCFGLNEVSMKHHAMEVSQQCILVADHSKFDQVRPACIGPLTLFDTVISDRSAADEFTQYFQQQQITFLTAE